MCSALVVWDMDEWCVVDGNAASANLIGAQQVAFGLGNVE